MKSEYFGLIVLSLFSPLAWVRKIETFKVGFIFGFAMIIVTLVTISAFCISINVQKEASTDSQVVSNGFIPVNYESYWSTIGFCFFMFEGIGGVMPIMGATKDRESYPYILTLTIGFLMVVYIAFANLCYYTYGSSLDKPIIMEMMPSDNIIIQIVKILFMINLVFSYPLTIFITNVILEGFTFKNTHSGGVKKWLKNLQRSAVLLFGIICAIYLRDSLDKILALSGTILGTTVVMKFPVICHLRLLAKTKTQKAIDLGILAISFGVLFLCTFQIIQ